MRLSKDEAICLILELSKDKEVSSPTKLNKLIARLNLFFIPIDIRFTLNKFGSFSTDLKSLETNDYYELVPYSYIGKSVNKFVLKAKGQSLFKETIKSKIDEILTKKEFDLLKETIEHLSSLSASEISDDEHKKLLVDVDDRFKLQQRVNGVSVDMYDIYQQIDEIPENTIADIRFKALIEYCYHLARYLKEIRFKRLSEKEYDFDAYMFDYYFLENLAQSIIPFLKEQLQKETKDVLRINKYYQYLINSVREDYPFSIDNKNLKELIV